MNSEENFAAVMAGDPPAWVDNEGIGASKDLGVKEPGGAIPLSEKGAVRLHPSGATNGNSKDGSAGRHERNGSMSGTFLAAPGYSPSFASLGDTHVFESHHAPRYSDTFEGFEPSWLSHSQEVQETPKVTRPEGLSFITPAVNHKISKGSETQASGPGTNDFSTPTTVEGHEGGANQEPKHHTSPIANLVEKHSAEAVPSSPSALPDQSPALGGVNSFSFGGPPQTPQTREMSHEPHVALKKIPGHELVESFMTKNKPSAPLVSPIGLDKVSAVSFPAVEGAPSHSDAAPSSGTHKEPQPVVEQSKRDVAQPAQLTSDEALLSAESAVVSSPSEISDTLQTDSPNIYSADSSKPEKSSDASNVATVSGGIGKEVVEKVIEHETATIDDKGVSSATSQNQIVIAPESFAFSNVEAEKGAPISLSTETSKPGID